MGLFSKLVEIKEEKPPTYESKEDILSESVIANVPEEIGKTLIYDIYRDNQLSDMSQSIFKVEELINSLPKEMPTVAKFSSVKAILENFSISCDAISNDDKKRISILSAALGDISEKTQADIYEKEQSIESFKEEISRLEKEISEQKAIFQNSKQLIDEEVSRIGKLNKFISGGDN